MAWRKRPRSPALRSSNAWANVLVGLGRSRAPFFTALHESETGTEYQFAALRRFCLKCEGLLPCCTVAAMSVSDPLKCSSGPDEQQRVTPRQHGNDDPAVYAPMTLPFDKSAR